MDQSQPAQLPQPGDWQLRKLSPEHKQVVALLVQGVDRSTIAEVCGYAEAYITFLSRQPLCQEYFRELQQFADLRLVALAEQSVSTISEVMTSGSDENR